MRRELTKTQRRRLRELSALAYERDLSSELAKLEEGFKSWRAGTIDAFELSGSIHRFHQGPSRELFSKYESRNLELVVAHAIHRGLLSAEEAGEEVLRLLDKEMALFRDHDA